MIDKSNGGGTPDRIEPFALSKTKNRPRWRQPTPRHRAVTAAGCPAGTSARVHIGLNGAACRIVHAPNRYPTAATPTPVLVTVAAICAKCSRSAGKPMRTKCRFGSLVTDGLPSYDSAVVALTTLFVAFYNFMRPHGRLKYNPPVPLRLPSA